MSATLRPVHRARIAIVRGDITTLDVDAFKSTDASVLRQALRERTPD